MSDPGDGRGVAWADINNDGDLDLFFGNDSGENRAVRQIQCAPDPWLHVEVVGAAAPTRAGPFSNRTGVGSRIRTVTPTLTQIREVNGGSGLGSQNSLISEFGFGPGVTLIDQVEVAFTDGEIRTDVNVLVDQVLTVEEWVHDVVATGSQFCDNGIDLFQLHLNFGTVIQPDSVRVDLYDPNQGCEGGVPRESVTQTSTSQSHTVVLQDRCILGDWSYVIWVFLGNATAKQPCTTISVSSCPDCSGQCPPPGCQIE